MRTILYLAITRREHFKSALILSLVLFLFGCGKEKATLEIPPATVETSELTFISPIGVELSGKVINPGSGKIIDHGFIYWFNAEDEIAKGTKVSLGSEIVSGFFKTTLNNLTFPEVNGLQALFVVKAYVTDKNGTHYGDIFSNRFKNTVVESILPDEGKTGDLITLVGAYKGLRASDIKITFGGTQAVIKTINETSITLELPTGIPAGHGQTVEVKATVGGVTADISHSFRIWANIKDMNPKSGPINTKIRFTGDNLPATKEALYVNFEPNSVVTGNSDFDDSFYISVPAQVNTDKLTLSYMTGNARIVLPWQFILTPPLIKSISPNPALDQQTVTIQLDNYLYLQRGANEFSVKVGNFQQWVMADEEGKLTFPLDYNAKYAVGNNYPVSIAYGPFSVKSNTQLSIIKPEATGFFPKKGLPGTIIHITGKFAKGAYYNVRFNNSDGGLSFSGVSDNEIIGGIYMGMPAKSYTLAVITDAGDVPIPGGTFEVLPTKFDSVSPLTATSGSTITITGEGFLNNGGQISANFAGHYAYVNAVTSTKLTLVLGNNTPPGIYRIKLDWQNQVFDTGLSITVVP
ncbi:hypothetical protein ACVWYN_000780 [Pedobacter sp. UYP24]